MGLFAAWMIGMALTVVLIGFPLLMLAWAAGLALMLWFTIKSVIGMIALFEGRAP